MEHATDFASQAITRRDFACALPLLGMAVAGLLTSAPGFSHAALATDEPAAELPPLPPAEPDPTSQFGVDLNINMATIDDYVGRPDVLYRDMRMIFDPADWESLGEDPYASVVLEGAKVVPYPFLGTVGPIPVDNAYDGDSLFTVTWNDDSTIEAVSSNYRESMQVLRELFPKDTPIFLMCGGAGYADFTKKLLTYLGWDPSLLYNVGGMWYYEGEHGVEVIDYGAKDDDNLYALWRADYAIIDFTLMRPETVRYQKRS